MFEYNTLKRYINEKLISEQVHPEDENVRIFNYTQKLQFSGEWDEVTRKCRGLILDIKSQKILARPFEKFFNYDEHVQNGWPIPAEVPVITEKFDGSLGILYFLNGKPHIATRGSFTSEQALWATEWFRKNVSAADIFNGELTHLFEIIFPQNRIVVNYDFSGLVYLGSIEIATGKFTEVTVPDIIRKPSKVRLRGHNISDLGKINLPNAEGFVLFFPEANVHMKIKFPEYIRLHKLITGVSEIAIWEMLKNAQGPDKLLEKVPDEFYQWVKGVRKRLYEQFTEIWKKADEARKAVKDFPTRKEQADWIMVNAKEVSAVVFHLLNGKEDKAIENIWKLIRPDGKVKFKINTEL